MARLLPAFEQLFDGSGDPLVSGTIDFFESGSSSVRKDTFSDSGETTVNANPLVLNGDGRVPNVFGTGTYRAILKTAAGVQLLQRDPVGGDLTLTFGSDWVASQTYGSTDVVREGGLYWESLVGSNLNNRPSLDAGANWAEVDLTPYGSDWNAVRTYAKTDVVRLTGLYYLSLVTANTNNNPASSPTKWEKLDVALQWDSVVTYDIGEIVEGSDSKSYKGITSTNQGNDPTSSAANWEEVKIRRVWNAAITYGLGDQVDGSDGLLYFSLIASNLNNNPTTDATSTNWRAADQLRSVDAGGTVDAITATYIPAVGALKDEMILRVRATGANATTTPTFSPNGLTAKTIVKLGNQALVAGDINAAGHELLLARNSTNDNWELLNPANSKFTSTEQTITSAGSLTLAHGLSTIPTRISAHLVNKTADVGYSVADKLMLDIAFMSTAIEDNRGLSIVPDSTNLVIRFGSSTNPFAVLNKSTGAGVNIALASWKIVFEAKI